MGRQMQKTSPENVRWNSDGALLARGSSGCFAEDLAKAAGPITFKIGFLAPSLRGQRPAGVFGGLGGIRATPGVRDLKKEHMGFAWHHRECSADVARLFYRKNGGGGAVAGGSLLGGGRIASPLNFVLDGRCRWRRRSVWSVFCLAISISALRALLFPYKKNGRLSRGRGSIGPTHRRGEWGRGFAATPFRRALLRMGRRMSISAKEYTQSSPRNMRTGVARPIAPSSRVIQQGAANVFSAKTGPGYALAPSGAARRPKSALLHGRFKWRDKSRSYFRGR